MFLIRVAGSVCNAIDEQKIQFSLDNLRKHNLVKIIALP